MKIEVIKDKCPQNHPCPAVRVCPFGALKQEGMSAPTVDYDKCIECGKCVQICPLGAIMTENAE